MDAATIQILVTANSLGVAAGLAPGLVALNTFALKSNNAISKVSTAMKGLSTATKVGVGVAVSVAAIGAAFAKTVGPAVAFEAAFAGVRKTVDGTPQQLEAIWDGLLQLAKTMPTTAVDLAAIAENAGQLGVAAPDVLKFTETVAKLGETTNLSFDQASQQIARFLNVTGGVPSDIDRIADAIVYLGNNTATTESEILTFGLRLGATASIAGFADYEILAIAASFSEMGVQAERGGSAVSRIMVEITESIKPGGENMAKFAELTGLTTAEFREMVKTDPSQVLIKFAEGLKGVVDDGEALAPVLEGLNLPGVRLSEVLRAMAENSNILEENLQGASDAVLRGTDLYVEYSKRTDTAAARIEIFKSKVNALKIEIGRLALGPIADTFDFLGEAVERVAEVMGPLAGEIVELFKNAAVNVGAFMDVIGLPVLKLFGLALLGVVMAATELLGAFNDLGPVAQVVVGGLGALIALAPAISFTSAGILGLAGASTAAAGALGTLATAFGVVVLPIGIVAGVTKQLLDAKSAAKAAGDAYREDFLKAINEDTGSFDDVQLGVQKIKDEISELEGTGTGLVKWGDDVGVVDTYWNNLKSTLRETIEYLPFVDNGVLNTRERLSELNDVLTSTGMERYEASVLSVSRATGALPEQVEGAIRAFGLQGEAVDGGSLSMQLLVDATRRAVLEEEVLKEATADLATQYGYTEEEIEAGVFTLESWGESAGLSAESAQFFGDMLGEIDFDNMTLDDVAVVDAFKDAFRETAAQLGLTTDEMIAQATASDKLAVAYTTMQAAISGTLTQYQTLGLQSRLAEQAQTDLTAAIVAFNDEPTEDNFVAVAEAARNLTAQQAGLRETVEEGVTAQHEQIEALILLGKEGKLSDEAIRKIIDTYGTLNETDLTEIIHQNENYREKSEELLRILRLLTDPFFGTVTIGGVTIADTELGALNLKLDEFQDPRIGHVSVEDDASETAKYIAAEINKIQDRRVAIEIYYKGLGRDQSNDGLKSGKSADGNIYMADGGMVLERPGAAKIYRPSPQNRIFAEPVTGGEAYIPLARSKRERSLNIWRETGKLLGAMAGAKSVSQPKTPVGGVASSTGSFASGGITAGTFIQPNGAPQVVVDVEVDATGIGNLAIDLAPINQSINNTARHLDDATASALYLGQAVSSLDDIPINLDEAVVAVQQGFESVGETAVETGKRIASGFRPSDIVERFAAIVQTTPQHFREFLGEWNGSLEQAVQKLEELGVDVDTVFKRIAFSGQGARRDLVAEFARAGVDISHEVQFIGEEMLRGFNSEQFLDEFSRISGWASDSFVDWLAAFDHSSDERIKKMREEGATAEEIFAETSAGRIAKLREEGATTHEIFEEMFDIDFAMDALEESGLSLAHIFQQLFEEGASAADYMDLVLDEVAGTVGEVDDSVRRLTDSFRILTGGTRDVIDAELDMRDAILRLKDTIEGDEEDGAGIFGYSSEEGIRNFKQLLRTGDAMREYAIAVAKSGVSTEEALATFDAMRLTFVDLATEAGLSEEEIATLADTLFNIPTATIIEVSVDGQQAALHIEKLEIVLKALADDVYSPVIDIDSELYDAAIAAIVRQMGLLQGEKVVVDVEVVGDEEAVSDLEDVQEGLDGIDPEKTIEVGVEGGDEATGELGDVKEAADAVGDSDPVVAVSVDKEGAESDLGDVKEAADKLAEDRPVPKLGLDTEEIDLILDRLLGVLQTIADLVTTTTITADTEEFLAKGVEVVEVLEGIQLTETVPKVGMDTDDFFSAAQRVDGKLNYLDGREVTTTVTNVVVNRTVTESEVNAAGGAMLEYHAGGYYDPEIVPPGTYRTFGERGTGGEAFIPLRNDWRRPRAMAIWNETGRRLGAPPRAGNSVSITAPINVEINASAGMDEGQLAAIAGEKIRAALSDAGRDLMNMR